MRGRNFATDRVVFLFCGRYCIGFGEGRGNLRDGFEHSERMSPGP